ncbi:MAG: HAD family phosphatase [Paraprevotella sp.]|nr:HAD family phosphatase [Paraprevotella sp.]
MNVKAALFDLDGVVFDTEPQYTDFWGMIGRRYLPNVNEFEYKIKGQTLVQIFEEWFPENENLQSEIVKALNDFEANMRYEYVTGLVDFLRMLKSYSVKTAIVTSSNRPKMQNVYAQHPQFKELFDAILTSEDFDESKPSPDCYLKAAAKLNTNVKDCVVFEDSINGVKSGVNAGMKVVGLSTTNPESVLASLCDIVIPNFESVGIEIITDLVGE